MTSQVNHKDTHQASAFPRSPSLHETEQQPANAAENEVPKDYKTMFDGRSALTKFVDPCEDARKESMRCLDKNNYKRDACTDFFRSYRECKKKWLDQRREDRRAGA